MSTFRILNPSLLASLVSMPQAIDLMRSAFSQLSHPDGKAQVPIRAHLRNKAGTESLYMPVSLEDSDAFGVKIVGMSLENLKRDLPFISAMVLVLDGQTGRVKGMLDGTFITSLRTGAASGLATELLARKDAEVLGVFGAGKQAVTQLEAVAAVRDLKRVYVFNRTRARAEAFVEEMGERLGLELVVANQANQLRECDIVCTATTSSTPIFDPAHISPGTHINAVGAYRTDMAEIPAETVVESRVFVDQVAATLAEAGDITQPFEAGLITREHFEKELGHVLLGIHAGRENEEQITLFKSVGNAAQDLVVADFALQEAGRQQLGMLIPWE